VTTRRIPLNELEPKRIALIKPSSLGDIVHSLPVLSALRGRFPRAHITWIVNRTYESLLVGHPDLDETMPFERHASRGGWWQASAGYARFLGRLRRRCFDLVIDLQGLLRSGVMALASGAPRRVGLGCAREGATWFYTDVIPYPDFQELHAVERNLRVARALGAGDQPPRFHVPVSLEGRRWAQAELTDCPRPWLAVGIGARWPTKRWPPAHFAALVQRAQELFGGTALLVGGPDEVPLAQEFIQRSPGPARLLAGHTSLAQLTAVVSMADVMIANDTGPLHLAAALGRPVVAPYTCTQVRRTGPFGQGDHAVETAVWCKGSYRRRCQRMDCLSELTPDRLWPVLRRILTEWQQRRPTLDPGHAAECAITAGPGQQLAGPA
jgi:heptosyltransferase-1